MNLSVMTISQVLETAGYGHRPSRHVKPCAHDIYRLDTGEVVATLRAGEAYDFAMQALEARRNTMIPGERALS
jgi:hypothetical protein